MCVPGITRRWMGLGVCALADKWSAGLRSNPKVEPRSPLRSNFHSEESA